MTTDNVYETYLSKFKFDAVVGASDKVKCKPDKQATEKLVSDFGVKKEEVVFIGDGETDVVTAINAEVNGIAVLWGYREKEQLLDAGAKVFANSPSELLNLIKEIK